MSNLHSSSSILKLLMTQLLLCSLFILNPSSNNCHQIDSKNSVLGACLLTLWKLFALVQMQVELLL